MLTHSSSSIEELPYYYRWCIKRYQRWNTANLEKIRQEKMDSVLRKNALETADYDFLKQEDPEALKKIIRAKAIFEPIDYDTLKEIDQGLLKEIIRSKSILGLIDYNTLKEIDRELLKEIITIRDIYDPYALAVLEEMDYNLLRVFIRKREKKIIETISPQQMVLHGPFKGLKYPAMDINEDALCVKMVGDYEAQLHPVMEQVCQTDYREVLDIGCAEGYYAVGFATRMHNTIVHGYDIDEASRQICQKTAILNGVADRVVLHEHCSEETLANFPFNGRAFVMADCEGYEMELFKGAALENLKNCDLLIELHECFVPGVTSTILSRFAPTHHIQIIRTTDKPVTHYPELDALSEEEHQAALSEHRGGIGKYIFMEWAWLTAKSVVA